MAHVSLRLLGDSELALRLPSIPCYALEILALYAFVRRRTRASVALVSALALSATSAYPYAFEARSYAAMLLFAILTLFCRQSVRMGRRRTLSGIGLAAGIAAGVYSHYYGALVLVPLAVAEGSAAVASRRFEPLVLLGAALGGASCLPLLGHIQSARRFSGIFWSGTDFSALPKAYQDLFDESLPAAAAALVLLLFVRGLLGRSGRRGHTEHAAEVRSDLAACAGFLLMPVGMYLLARFVSKAAYYRYTLATVAGAAGGLGLLIHTCGEAGAGRERPPRRARLEPPRHAPLELQTEGPDGGRFAVRDGERDPADGGRAGGARCPHLPARAPLRRGQ